MTDQQLSRDTIPVNRAFVCTDCQHRWYYTRSRCLDCDGNNVSTYELTEGEVISLTENTVTPPDVRAPNKLGLVRFGDIKLIAQLNNANHSVGSRVKFAGEYRLREENEVVEPRLVPAEP